MNINYFFNKEFSFHINEKKNLPHQETTFSSTQKRKKKILTKSNQKFEVIYNIFLVSQIIENSFLLIFQSCSQKKMNYFSKRYFPKKEVSQFMKNIFYWNEKTGKKISGLQDGPSRDLLPIFSFLIFSLFVFIFTICLF